MAQFDKNGGPNPYSVNSVALTIPLVFVATAPGGFVLLPDQAGNGAFAAIDNNLERRQTTLLLPGRVGQEALCLMGRCGEGISIISRAGLPVGCCAANNGSTGTSCCTAKR